MQIHRKAGGEGMEQEQGLVAHHVAMLVFMSWLQPGQRLVPRLSGESYVKTQVYGLW